MSRLCGLAEKDSIGAVVVQRAALPTSGLLIEEDARVDRPGIDVQANAAMAGALKIGNLVGGLPVVDDGHGAIGDAGGAGDEFHLHTAG